MYFIYKKVEEKSDKWSFDIDFYLQLNISVGGSWGGIGGVDEGAFPAQMEIDYVRYYQKVN